jgi:hypothetical protein
LLPVVSRIPEREPDSVMNRTRTAYERRFRTALGRFGARRPDQGVGWLLRRAEHIRSELRISPTQAFAAVYEALLAKSPCPTPVNSALPQFFCDAGLGGLARWLRAAGYEALWKRDIDDDDLLRRARATGTILLTTDSLLMERRVLRDGRVPALWMPPSLTPVEQLTLVLRELGLPVRPPRCMTCGGELQRVGKEAVKDRIPPKTARWLDEYFLCRQCDKLYWQGTHWQRIQRRLGTLTP